jgi:hypothetical protein
MLAYRALLEERAPVTAELCRRPAETSVTIDEHARAQFEVERYSSAGRVRSGTLGGSALASMVAEPSEVARSAVSSAENRRVAIKCNMVSGWVEEGSTATACGGLPQARSNKAIAAATLDFGSAKASTKALSAAGVYSRASCWMSTLTRGLPEGLPDLPGCQDVLVLLMA